MEHLPTVAVLISGEPRNDRPAEFVVSRDVSTFIGRSPSWPEDVDGDFVIMNSFSDVPAGSQALLSRTHGRFYFVGDRLFFEDGGIVDGEHRASTNGTLVNNLHVAPRASVELKLFDELNFGSRIAKGDTYIYRIDVGHPTPADESRTLCVPLLGGQTDNPSVED